MPFGVSLGDSGEEREMGGIGREEEEEGGGGDGLEIMGKELGGVEAECWEGRNRLKISGTRRGLDGL